MSGFTGQISLGTDNAKQSSTAMVVNGPSGMTINASTTTYTGYRIQNVTIPNAATISAAALSVWFTTFSGTGSYSIDCENDDNSVTFAAVANNISSRTLTGNSASWTPSGITTGHFSSAPSIETAVQAVINLSGWASGDPITTIIKCTAESGASHIVATYAVSTSEAAELSITYTSGSTPAAPTGLSLSLNADGTIGGTCTLPGGTLTGLSVQIATNSAFTTGVQSGTISGSAVTTFTVESVITPISRDTEYWVEVAAINGAGIGTYSSSQSITTGPAAPTGLAATNAPSPVASWTNPTPTGGATLTDNKLRYSTDLIHWTTVDVGSVATTYTFSGLTASTVYYFAVSAVDTNGQGYWSHGGYFTVIPIPAENPLLNVFIYAVTAAVTSVMTTLEPVPPDKLTSGWTKNGSDASMAATLADTNDANYLTPPAASGAYLVVPLQNCPSNLLAVTDATFNARVKRTGGDTAGVICTMESAVYYTANGTSPGANPGLSAGGTTTAPSVGAGLTTSFADYSVDSDGYLPLSGTQGNTDWTGAYLLLLWDDDTNAYDISEASVTITFWTIAPPSAPTGLAVVNDGSSPTTALDVSWSAAATAATYDLGQASSLGGSYSDTTGISGTTDTISGLTPATEYSFEVAATNAGGTSSYSSAVAWATASAAPSGVSATPSAGAALVAWTAPTMGTNCQIASYSLRYEYPPGNGNWTTITGISSSATSHLVSGLTPGTEYGFEVACLIQSSNSDWAGTIQSAWGTEEDATPPAPAVPVPLLPPGYTGIGASPLGLTRRMRQGQVEGVRYIYYCVAAGRAWLQRQVGKLEEWALGRGDRFKRAS